MESWSSVRRFQAGVVVGSTGFSMATVYGCCGCAPLSGANRSQDRGVLLVSDGCATLLRGPSPLPVTESLTIADGLLSVQAR